MGIIDRVKEDFYQRIRAQVKKEKKNACILISALQSHDLAIYVYSYSASLDRV